MKYIIFFMASLFVVSACASGNDKNSLFTTVTNSENVLAENKCDREAAIDCIRGICDVDDTLDSNEYYTCKQQCLEDYGC